MGTDQQERRGSRARRRLAPALWVALLGFAVASLWPSGDRGERVSVAPRPDRDGPEAVSMTPSPSEAARARARRVGADPGATMADVSAPGREGESAAPGDAGASTGALPVVPRSEHEQVGAGAPAQLPEGPLAPLGTVAGRAHAPQDAEPAGEEDPAVDLLSEPLSVVTDEEELASEELASEELAREELASEELASEELAGEELAPVVLGLGDDCGRDVAGVCPPGTVCEGPVEGAGRCLALCDLEAVDPCREGESCAEVAFREEGFEGHGLCVEVASCDVLEQTGCPEGAACVPIRAVLGWTRMCQESGDVPESGACSVEAPCMPGFGCWSIGSDDPPRCHRYCALGTTCEGGEACLATGITTGELGLCP